MRILVGFVMICAFAVSACGQSTAANLAPSPTAQVIPAGARVPDQLLGNWLMPLAAADSVSSGSCPKPLTATSCTFMLTFTETTYAFTTTVPGTTSGGGDVVVNRTEIDFFRGNACGMLLPAGVGRYRWTIANGSVTFAPLNTDPCPSEPYLANQTYVKSA